MARVFVLTTAHVAVYIPAATGVSYISGVPAVAGAPSVVGFPAAAGIPAIAVFPTVDSFLIMTFPPILIPFPAIYGLS